MFSGARKKMYSYLSVNKYNKYNKYKENLIDETKLGPTKLDPSDNIMETTMDSTSHSREEEKSMDVIKRELEENGYCVVPNVYNSEEIEEYKNEFFKWYKTTENVEMLHTIIHGNGIFKYFEIGHQRFAWLARTNSKIVNIFKGLWNTDELVTAFDGCCYYASEFEGKPNYWTHTDQSSRKKGLHCYQSFLSLTNNSERTLIVYKGSHLLHEH